MAEDPRRKKQLTPHETPESSILNLPETFPAEHQKVMEEYIKNFQASGMESPATASIAEAMDEAANDKEKQRNVIIATSLILGILSQFEGGAGGLEELLAALANNPMIARSPLALSIINDMLGDLDGAEEFLQKAKENQQRTMQQAQEKVKTEPKPEPSLLGVPKEDEEDSLSLSEMLEALFKATTDKISALNNPRILVIIITLRFINTNGEDLKTALDHASQHPLVNESPEAMELIEQIRNNPSVGNNFFMKTMDAIHEQRADAILGITKTPSPFDIPKPAPSAPRKNEDEPPSYEDATRYDSDEPPSHDEVTKRSKPPSRK